MAKHKTAGTKFYIGPVADIDAIKAMSAESAMAYFEAIISGDWTEVEEIESFGNLGDTSDVATFTAVGDARVTKLPTTKDAGTLEIVCAHDTLDDGQIALADAYDEGFNHAFKVTYNDARTTSYSPTTDYFAGIVLSKQVNIGDVQAVTKQTFNVGVNTAVYTDATDPTGS